MKFCNRLTALALTGVLSLSLLAGCQQPASGSQSGAISVPEGVIMDINAIEDFSLFLSGVPSNEVVATMDGQEIAAGELMLWIASNCDDISDYYYSMYGDAAMPWDAPGADGKPMSAFILEKSVEYAGMQRLARIKGEELGLSVSQEDKDAIQAVVDQMAQTVAADGVTVDQYFWQQGLTAELYRWNCESDYYYEALSQYYFGPGSQGEPTQEKISAWLKERGEYKVKHILLAIFDETGMYLDDEGVAAQKAKAEEIHAQLKKSKDLPGEFDQLMKQYSEDPGLASYPDGYVFTPDGSVDPIFEQAALALKPGQMSEIVEGASGYHIILRLPLDEDLATRSEEYINAKMNEMADSWIKQADIQTTAAFDRLEVGRIYENLCAYREGLVQHAQKQNPQGEQGE